MSDFNMEEFFALLHTLGVDAEQLSALQLDQYIAAYKNGARDPASLEVAILQPSFPINVVVHAHIDGDDLQAIGEQLNLNGQVLRKFVSAAGPLKLQCSVESDGSLIVDQIDDFIDLGWGLVLN